MRTRAGRHLPHHRDVERGAGALDDYTVTNAGAEFTIDKRACDVDDQPCNKTYGDADPSPLTTGSGSGFLAADAVTATYSRVPGETVAGRPLSHHRDPESRSWRAGNYIVTNAGADFTIDKRMATWTTNDARRRMEIADPSPLTTGSGSGFLAADNITASYSRAAGETCGRSVSHHRDVESCGAARQLHVTNAGAEFTINQTAGDLDDQCDQQDVW